MKKVLIFGSCGYISSSVIDLLLQDQIEFITDGNADISKSPYEIWGFDNNYKCTCDTLLPFMPNPNFHFISGDITDEDDVKRAYEQVEPDYILHAAALVGYPICLKYKAVATLVNVEGTRNVVENKPAHSQLAFCSTGSVYKPNQTMCDELSEAEPPSHYGWTKIEGEKIVLASPNTIVFRFGTAMGISKNNIRVNLLANDLTYQSYLNKTITIFEHTFLRSFIHVRDIASAIVFTFANFNEMEVEEIHKNRIFNVSNNALNLTKGELCELISKKLKSHVCYAEVGKDVDKRNYIMNCDKIYSYGWRPQVGLEETIDELVKVAPVLSTYEKYK